MEQQKQQHLARIHYIFFILWTWILMINSLGSKICHQPHRINSFWIFFCLDFDVSQPLGHDSMWYLIGQSILDSTNKGYALASILKHLVSWGLLRGLAEATYERVHFPCCERCKVECIQNYIYSFQLLHDWIN